MLSVSCGTCQQSIGFQLHGNADRAAARMPLSDARLRAEYAHPPVNWAYPGRFANADAYVQFRRG
jgi:hypothetical protein